MQAVKDNALLDDPKYRQYINAIDKALKNFETSSEWADLISALGKLNKALNPKYKTIPKKITVGKRLAQCMHPALPGGVHLKALQVYETVFNIIKKRRLRTDLYIYSTGIFPLLANASMQVRPVLLNLYENHLLPLGPTLRTCCDGMLLGLLPGLEEGADYFERTDVLLENLSERVGQLEFHSAIWRCVLSSAAARLPAIQLVLRRFDRKRSAEDQLYVIGSDINVMVYSLCECFQDANVLCQRAALDVLVLVCPLSSAPVSKSDCCTLLTSAVQCVLRRDMSLNRRLYTWLLGCDQSKMQKDSKHLEPEVASYFENHSKALLIEALKSILLKQRHHIMSKWNNEKLPVSMDDLFPLKLLVSLLDKPEIGPPVIEDLLVDVFRLLHASVSCVNDVDPVHRLNAGINEISKTASLLLGIFEPGYVWRYLSHLLRRTRSSDFNWSDADDVPSFVEVCQFLQLLLSIVNVENYQEVRNLHLPGALTAVITCMSDMFGDASLRSLRTGLITCNKLLDMCQPNHPDLNRTSDEGTSDSSAVSFVSSAKGDSGTDQEVHSVSACARHFHHFLCEFIKTRLQADSAGIAKCLSALEVDDAVKDDGVWGNPEFEKTTASCTTIESRESNASETSESLTEALGVFHRSCQLLLDFACFPVYCNGRPGSAAQLANVEKAKFPEWLSCMFWVAHNDLNNRETWFPFMACALSTTLDLMSLSLSVSQEPDQSDDLRSDGTVSVVVLSPMSSTQAEMIVKETKFFQHMVKELWTVLGESSMSVYHLECVQLLVRLHSMAPDSRCEDVILEAIMHHDKNIRCQAFSKFCRLWHLTRTVTDKKFAPHAVGRSRPFLRCLFAVVESLQFSEADSATLSSRLFRLNEREHAVTVAMARRWLRQCLEERDLLRILEPYLMIALHPRTQCSPLHCIRDRQRSVTLQVIGVETENVGGETNQAEILSFSSLEDRFRPKSSAVRPATVSSVISEINNGKLRYRELISKLTAEQSTEEDEILATADDIVRSVIEESLHVVEKANTKSKCVSAPPGEVPTPSGSALEDTENTSMTVEPSSCLVEEEEENAKPSESNSHMLAYQDTFDAKRVHYALRSILALYECNPSLFAYSASTTLMTSLATQAGDHGAQELLSRHQQSTDGKQFNDDVTTRSYNVMIIEVLVIVCLRYLRSWHPNADSAHSLQDVRSTACQLLTELIDQLTALTLEKGLAFRHVISSSPASSWQQLGAFVSSILSKHHISEIALRALASTVHALHAKQHQRHPTTSTHGNFTRRAFMSMDETEVGFWWSGSDVNAVNALQSDLLALVRSLIIFEHRSLDVDPPSVKAGIPDRKLWKPTANDGSLTYVDGLPISQQPMLINLIIRVLRLQTASEMHADWLDFLTFTLPCLSRALPALITPVVSQLCRNLEQASALYVTKLDGGTGHRKLQATNMPADYVTTMLKNFRELIHMTLALPSSNAPSSSAAHSYTANDRVSALSTGSGSSSSNQAPSFSTIGSIFSVFGSTNTVRTQQSVDDQEVSSDWSEAHRITLRNLPRILSCLAVVWSKVVSTKTRDASANDDKPYPNVNPCIVMGNSDAVSQAVLQLINPIALQHGENLLSALAIVWERRGRLQGAKPDDFLSLNDQQRQLVEIACAIRSLHCDVLISLVKRVAAHPPDHPAAIGNKKRKMTQEECLLDFTLHYVQQQSRASLQDSRASFLLLARECLAMAPPVAAFNNPTLPPLAGATALTGGRRQLSPRSYFLLLLLLFEYARRLSNCDDKKEQKEMQDMSVKCIEACNSIVDWSLEHGGWLARRAPTVLPGSSQHDLNSLKEKLHTESSSSIDLTDPQAGEASVLKSTTSDPIVVKMKHEEPPNIPESAPPSLLLLPQTSNPNYEHSVRALHALGQVLANLLDLVFGSEEKEKMLPVLTVVMLNVTPYLKNFSVAFTPSYRAAVRLLSSVSGYQQTRRAWKKEALDLFLEPSFFHMPLDCVTEWRDVVDHLMTHDATTFKDLLVRIGFTRNAATGPSLNFFSNKEQELELRAMLLKRLAFVIFSSGVNQYQRHLPEILERLSESLRLHLVPAVQKEVFLCFRVILLRVSPHNLTSLWPSVITELIQVLGQMEQELTLHQFDCEGMDSFDFPSKSNRLTLASGSSSSGSAASNSLTLMQEKWMSMYLSACKLLDLALILQPNQLNHFKTFRWAFVGEPGENIDDPDEDHDENTRPSLPLKEGRRNAIDESVTRPFIPHCVRIKRLMATKKPSGSSTLVATSPLQPLLELRKLSSLYQLQPFFNTIVSPSTMLAIHPTRGPPTSIAPAEDVANLSSPVIEALLRKDFVEETV